MGGKEQKIEIKASSGLSDEEVEKMVKDGKLHEEEDKKFSELVSIRNNADAIIHGTEKNMKNAGDKISSINRAKLESAINDLKDVLKKDDKSIIESKINHLNNISTEILSETNKNNTENKPNDRNKNTANNDSNAS